MITYKKLKLKRFFINNTSSNYNKLCFILSCNNIFNLQWRNTYTFKDFYSKNFKYYVIKNKM